MVRKYKTLPAIILLIYLAFTADGQHEKGEKKVLVAVFAHADDESVVAPMLARYARQNAEVYLIIATDGSKGVRGHANIPAGESLAQARAHEARCAAERPGIHPPVLLGLEDGSLGQADKFTELHNLLDSILIHLRPDAVITWDPGGYYGHIDHRIVSNVITELYQQENAMLTGQLFYFGVPYRNQKTLPPLKTDLAQGLLRNTLSTRRSLLTYSITFSEEDKERARSALFCHESQFTREEMEDLFLLNTVDTVLHLRPVFDQGKGGTDVFEN